MKDPEELKESSPAPGDSEDTPSERAIETDEEQDLDFYIKTIEALRKERDEYYDLLLRKQAEFENYRKRVDKEREDSRIAAYAEVLRQLLPVLDSCEKGLESLESAESADRLSVYQEGYRLLHKGLLSLLEKFDVEPVPGAGAEFDPTVHEAVLREVCGRRREGEILEEYRKGYSIKGRLLRPSQVKVAVEPEEETSEN